MKYQKPHHSWGPGTMVDVRELPRRELLRGADALAAIEARAEDVDDQPEWWRALKGFGIILGVLTGGLLLFALFVVINGQWMGDD